MTFLCLLQSHFITWLQSKMFYQHLILIGPPSIIICENSLFEVFTSDTPSLSALILNMRKKKKEKKTRQYNKKHAFSAQKYSSICIIVAKVFIRLHMAIMVEIKYFLLRKNQWRGVSSHFIRDRVWVRDIRASRPSPRPSPENKASRTTRDRVIGLEATALVLIVYLFKIFF